MQCVTAPLKLPSEPGRTDIKAAPPVGVQVDGPHARRGRLKNGNPPGDLATAPRCGAKTRHGTACCAPAMANGRCRMHGGLSTGPRTAEGRERCRMANWKHGLYSQQAVAARRAKRRRLRWLRQCLTVLSRLDRMWALLFEIADQADSPGRQGFERRCARALLWWREYRAVCEEVKGPDRLMRGIEERLAAAAGVRPEVHPAG